MNPHSKCLSVGRRQKTAAFDAVFGVVPTPPFRESLPPPLTLSRRHQAAKLTGHLAFKLARALPSIFLYYRAFPKTAPHLSSCLLGAQNGPSSHFGKVPGSYLRAAYALSLSKMALRGCPSSTLLGASLRLALTRVYHLAVAYISLALCAISPIQPSLSPQPHFPQMRLFLAIPFHHCRLKGDLSRIEVECEQVCFQQLIPKVDAY